MIVFDFDKTLTNDDTLFGFYRAVNKEGIFFPLKRLLFFVIAIGKKIKLIDNHQLKKLGIYIFLKGKTKEELKNAAESYASEIDLNTIYRTDFLNCAKQNRLIISASYEIYINELFPDETIIASRLAYKQNRVEGIKRNVFGKNKQLILREMGIQTIEWLYTDSYTDRPLMEMAEQVYLVNEGGKKKIK
jgi:phosphoserine phosphatase